MDVEANMKEMDEIKNVALGVFKDLKDGGDIKRGGELNNTLGKYLKAEQLKVAWAHLGQNQELLLANLAQTGTKQIEHAA